MCVCVFEGGGGGVGVHASTARLAWHEVDTWERCEIQKWPECLLWMGSVLKDLERSTNPTTEKGGGHVSGSGRGMP